MVERRRRFRPKIESGPEQQIPKTDSAFKPVNLPPLEGIDIPDFGTPDVGQPISRALGPELGEVRTPAGTLYWPNSARGLEQPGHMYLQVMTPVNMKDPVEVARYYRQHPRRPRRRPWRRPFIWPRPRIPWPSPPDEIELPWPPGTTWTNLPTTTPGGASTMIMPNPILPPGYEWYTNERGVYTWREAEGSPGGGTPYGAPYPEPQPITGSPTDLSPPATGIIGEGETRWPSRFPEHPELYAPQPIPEPTPPQETLVGKIDHTQLTSMLGTKPRIYPRGGRRYTTQLRPLPLIQRPR